MRSDPTLILLPGPTAVGKTRTAISLAQELEAPIISADSRQVYKELHIGVAKPSSEELAQADHHLIGTVSIHEPFSVAQWLDEARRIIQSKSSEYIIITGGTGLYYRALLNGLDSHPPVDPQLREQLNLQLSQSGLDSLVKELIQLDPKAADHVALDNPRRVMRALELVKQTGKPLAQLYGGSSPPISNPTLTFGLEMERGQLYERINQRVDQMINRGLEDEAKDLLPHRHLQALQTVGYSEWFDHFLGRTEREAAIDLIKRNTRRYAKRQLTWFRNQMSCTWFKPDQVNDILATIRKK
jgi:tRNA dimethylallyltransferase